MNIGEGSLTGYGTTSMGGHTLAELTVGLSLQEVEATEERLAAAGCGESTDCLSLSVLGEAASAEVAIASLHEEHGETVQSCFWRGHWLRDE